MIFSSDGTVRVYKVTRTKFYRGYSVPGQGYGEEGQGGCRKLYQIIDTETLIGSYTVADTPIIFAEDHLWVEGTIKGRITVVAARFPIVSTNANIWIRNNLVYDSYDGTNTLGLIAENDIYFARDLPEDFKIDGALMAQQGKIIRHGYFNWCGGTSQAVKDKLTINGALISYFKSYWNFGTAPDSGFVEREINYDTNFLYNSPPIFPFLGRLRIHILDRRISFIQKAALLCKGCWILSSYRLPIPVQECNQKHRVLQKPALLPG